MAETKYVLEPEEKKAFGDFPEGCTLDRIESIFKSIGVTPSKGVARFYPFVYGFSADRELTDGETSVVLESLEKVGYGKMELRMGRV